VVCPSPLLRIVPADIILLPIDVVKYFHEEPVHLEALSAESDPDARRRAAPEMPLEALLSPTEYFRGYLAGSRIANDGEQVGLTAIAHPGAFVDPLLDVFGGLRWTAARRGAEIDEVEDPAAALRDPSALAVLVGAEGAVSPDDLRAVAETERRYAIPELQRLLAASHVVAFPEPAHDGWDWSLFTAKPLKERLVTAFRRHPVEGVRRFVLPFQRARSEHKFYFERWTLDDLPDYVEEIGQTTSDE
jgi:hypothetical protein